MTKKEGWISVKDRLPKPDKLVLTYPYYDSNHIHCSNITGENIWHLCNSEITHWMPRPNPPQGAKDEN